MQLSKTHAFKIDEYPIAHFGNLEPPPPVAPPKPKPAPDTKPAPNPPTPPKPSK